MFVYECAHTCCVVPYTRLAIQIREKGPSRLCMSAGILAVVAGAIGVICSTWFRPGINVTCLNERDTQMAVVLQVSVWPVRSCTVESNVPDVFVLCYACTRLLLGSPVQHLLVRIGGWSLRSRRGASCLRVDLSFTLVRPGARGLKPQRP